MRRLLGHYPRLGSRRIRIMLGREGIAIGKEGCSRLISVHGAPRYMRRDSAPAFVSSALLKWAVSEKIESALIDPGMPEPELRHTAGVSPASKLRN